MHFEPDANIGGAVLKRVLPVACYYSRLEDAEQVARRDVALSLTLLHDVIDKSVAPGEPQMADATPILMEAPQLTAHPPVRGGYWSHVLLASDHAESAPCFDIESGAPLGEAPISNIIMQFSPLEITDWRALDSGKPRELLRGVQIARQGRAFAFRLIYQTLPDGDVIVAGPVPLRLDEKTQRLMLSARAGVWRPLEEMPGAKAVFLALFHLRALSPIVKAEAFAFLTAGLGDGMKRHHAAINGAAAGLYRMRHPRGRRDWYVMRDHDNEPYVGSPTYIVGSIEIESPLAYADLDLATIGAAIEAKLASS